MCVCVHTNLVSIGFVHTISVHWVHGHADLLEMKRKEQTTPFGVLLLQICYRYMEFYSIMLSRHSASTGDSEFSHNSLIGVWSLMLSQI